MKLFKENFPDEIILKLGTPTWNTQYESFSNNFNSVANLPSLRQLQNTRQIEILYHVSKNKAFGTTIRDILSVASAIHFQSSISFFSGKIEIIFSRIS